MSSSHSNRQSNRESEAHVNNHMSSLQSKCHSASVISLHTSCTVPQMSYLNLEKTALQLSLDKHTSRDLGSPRMVEFICS